MSNTAMPSFLETERLVSLAIIRKDVAMLPADRGVYGLFFKQPPGEAPTANCLVREGLWLLYIGTAGADLSKSGDLRRRLGRQHLGGDERRSTVCQTLAALLPEVVGPATAKNERGRVKFHTSPSGASQLRRWMDEHIFACWTAFLRPADLEEKLILQYRPPLNLDFSDHPFASKLALLRNQRRK
ncbi:MAG: hypothetical protein J2O44_03215, partial [Porphyrobacter sp.]|nr:hypothetical protein [Porphyrobacter sp.]